MRTSLPATLARGTLPSMTSMIETYRDCSSGAKSTQILPSESVGTTCRPKATPCRPTSSSTATSMPLRPSAIPDHFQRQGRVQIVADPNHRRHPAYQAVDFGIDGQHAQPARRLGQHRHVAHQVVETRQVRLDVARGRHQGLGRRFGHVLPRGAVAQPPVRAPPACRGSFPPGRCRDRASRPTAGVPPCPGRRAGSPVSAARCGRIPKTPCRSRPPPRQGRPTVEPRLKTACAARPLAQRLDAALVDVDDNHAMLARWPRRRHLQGIEHLQPQGLHQDRIGGAQRQQGQQHDQRGPADSVPPPGQGVAPLSRDSSMPIHHGERLEGCCSASPDSLPYTKHQPWQQSGAWRPCENH